MKHFFIISFLFLLTVSAHSQMGVAKIKYQEAEEAYTDKKYELCIEKLNEVVEVLKETNPRVQYLRIVCYSKIVEKDPITHFPNLLQLKEYCISYLTNYDNIQGLEDKYKTVYTISESLKKYPKNEEEYQQVMNLRKKGRIYRYNNDSLDYVKAITYFKEAYNRGDMRSLVEMATIYRIGGYGVSIDISRMYQYYDILASYDIAEGQYYIGLAHLQGTNGYAQDTDKAFKLIYAASEQSFVFAIATRAIIEFCYYHRWKATASKEKLAQMTAATEEALLIALKAGASTGEFYYYMGKAYTLGVISPGVNYEKAVEFFKKSADLGNEKGKNALGYFYLNGLGGLPKDAPLALTLFRYAADRILAAAEYNLSRLYMNGAPGVEKSSKLFQYWNDRYTVNPNKSIDQIIINATNEIY